MPSAGKLFLWEWVNDKLQTVSDLVLQAQDMQMQDCIYKTFSAAEAAQNPWRKFLKCWHKRGGDSKATLAAGKTHCTKPAGSWEERETTIFVTKILSLRCSATRKARCSQLFFQ